MNKLLILTAMATLTWSSMSFADVLNGSKWQTIDDKTGQPKAIVQFKQQANGTFTGTIIQVLTPANVKSCTTCKGRLKGKPLQGFTVVRNLRLVSNNTYKHGEIFDPQDDKSYSLTAELKNGGSVLNMRGYVGISLIGRTQVWKRVP